MAVMNLANLVAIGRCLQLHCVASRFPHTSDSVSVTLRRCQPGPTLIGGTLLTRILSSDAL